MVRASRLCPDADRSQALDAEHVAADVRRSIVPVMRPDEFFITSQIPDAGGGYREYLNSDLVRRIEAGPVAEGEDIEVAVALANLLHQELMSFGTDDRQTMSGEESRAALRALNAVIARLGIEDIEIPFRDFGSFRSYWVQKGASGSGGWQKRRNLLAEIFDPLHDRLAVMEQQAMSATLADPISRQKRTGWSAVDTEIGELRRAFQNATTPQQYRAVGLSAVAVLEALSAQVYDPARHLRSDEEEPSVDKTKQRIERFVEDALPGSENTALRRLARPLIEFAHEVKHSSTPSRMEAGIAGDGVIQLAYMLRRISDEDSDSIDGSASTP